MNIRTAVAGAGLALSLTAFAPLVHAQMGNPANPTSPGANPPGGYGAPGAAGGVPMNEGAAGSTGAQQRATQVANEIEQAKSQGKNVEGAQHEQRLGERALKRGEEKTAMRHFTRAERALGMANGMRPRMENNGNGTTNPGANDNPSSRRDTADLRMAQAGGGAGGGMGGAGGGGMGSGGAGGPATGGTMGGAGTAGGGNGSGAATEGGSGNAGGENGANGSAGTNGGSGMGAPAGGLSGGGMGAGGSGMGAGGGGMGGGGAGSGGMGGSGGAGGGAGAP